MASAQDTDFSLQIQHAQSLLLLKGSTLEVLSEYDSLIQALTKAALAVPEHSRAQVHYQRALVKIGLGKAPQAIADLLQALDIDPSFAPAATKLLQTWLERGQFAKVRARFSPAEVPEIYAKMDAWDAAYAEVSAGLDLAPDGPALDELCGVVDRKLAALLPSNVAVAELRLRLLKKRAFVAQNEHEHVSYDGIVRAYATLLRILPQKNLAWYAEHSEYLLWTRGSFDEAWKTVKACLRIDNEHRECGSLSKLYNRLQHVLRPLEQYFMLADYLYPTSSPIPELPDDQVDALDVDFKQIDQDLTGPVPLAERELRALPASVKTLHDFLVFRAREFTAREFGDEKLAENMPLVEVLNKLACEASIHVKGDKQKFCALVDDREKPFLPKHVAHIDSLLKRKNFQAAKEALVQYNKNIKKTGLFQKRWKVVQEVELRKQRQQQQQQQQQQQEYFRQQQHHHHQQQHQQQQQQQTKFDPSKDYYKLLDVSKDADEQTLKRAYRAQTLKYHPDKYKGTDLLKKEIELKMQDINEAYEILSDPEARANYDRGPQEPHHGGHHFQQSHGAQNVRVNFNHEDFVNHFGGGGGGGFRFQF
ncbi:DnaJ-domain-containing protein [Metschnikowia bicuspidata var. bicuspidata NRRL YB-4993]|uniref:DnaJ-domain-containing protein n=1 Tax=Metschnikowia bicuspidata var. bicuspidata NRRL YB-4993 TaxID=869754 RepID=A0A1A0HC52_9ASCO|nr:DnaJ-domain-containing protein [Metschnikowia bicuspidata var. bicuspidata NRRL YB-4993]OBA21457.1 DnaJ-domain-containing protein [Metschnikowia bicuspidata var. bicuspidata NRRL YB-4993]